MKIRLWLVEQQSDEQRQAVKSGSYLSRKMGLRETRHVRVPQSYHERERGKLEVNVQQKIPSLFFSGRGARGEDFAQTVNYTQRIKSDEPSVGLAGLWINLLEKICRQSDFFFDGGKRLQSILKKRKIKKDDRRQK